MTGELGADGDDEADEEEGDADEAEDDMLLVPSPLKGAKVAPCGELASPVTTDPIRIWHGSLPVLPLPLYLPLAVAGDKLRPVGGPVEVLAKMVVALTGVVGVSARALWWFSVWRRNDLASQ